MQAVILQVEEGKQARAELEKEIKSREGDFTKRKEELDKMNKDWQAQAAVMSEEARLGKQKDFQEKFLSLRNDEMAFRDDVKRKEQKATQAIAAKVEAIVQKIAKEKSLEAVFELSSAGLVYLNNPVDLTKDVVTAYSKQPKTAKK
jgi:outer membrane protein